MRILTVGNMYPPHHLGGYELIWHSAVEHLRAAGHQVTVLTTDFRRARAGPGIAEDPAAHRDLRWYWHDHEFPPMSARRADRAGAPQRRVLARHWTRCGPTS